MAGTKMNLEGNYNEEDSLEILFKEEIKGLGDDGFEGSKEEFQIFMEVFYRNNKANLSKSCFVCEAVKPVTGQDGPTHFICYSNGQNSNVTSQSSKDSSGEDTCTVGENFVLSQGSPKEINGVTVSDGVLESSTYWEGQAGRDKRAKQVKKMFNGAPSDDVEDASCSMSEIRKDQIESLKVVDFAAVPLILDNSNQEVTCLLAESSSLGIVSRQFRLKLHQEMDVQNEVDDGKHLQAKRATSCGRHGKTVADSKALAHGSKGKKVSSVRRDIKNVDKSKFVTEPVSQEISRHLLSGNVTTLGENPVPVIGVSKKFTKKFDTGLVSDLRIRLRKHVTHILMAVGWKIELRTRSSCSKVDALYRSPEGSGLKTFSKAWKLCGHSLFAGTVNLLREGNEKEWVDTTGVWHDLSDVLTHIEEEMHQMEISVPLSCRWRLLDPFVTILIIDRKMGVLKAGGAVKVVNGVSIVVNQKVHLALADRDIHGVRDEFMGNLDKRSVMSPKLDNICEVPLLGESVGMVVKRIENVHNKKNDELSTSVSGMYSKLCERFKNMCAFRNHRKVSHLGQPWKRSIRSVARRLGDGFLEALDLSGTRSDLRASLEPRRKKKMQRNKKHSSRDSVSAQLENALAGGSLVQYYPTLNKSNSVGNDLIGGLVYCNNQAELTTVHLNMETNGMEIGKEVAEQTHQGMLFLGDNLQCEQLFIVQKLRDDSEHGLDSALNQKEPNTLAREMSFQGPQQSMHIEVEKGSDYKADKCETKEDTSAEAPNKKRCIRNPVLCYAHEGHDNVFHIQNQSCKETSVVQNMLVLDSQEETLYNEMDDRACKEGMPVHDSALDLKVNNMQLEPHLSTNQDRPSRSREAPHKKICIRNFFLQSEHVGHDNILHTKNKISVDGDQSVSLLDSQRVNLCDERDGGPYSKNMLVHENPLEPIKVNNMEPEPQCSTDPDSRNNKVDPFCLEQPYLSEREKGAKSLQQSDYVEKELGVVVALGSSICQWNNATSAGLGLGLTKKISKKSKKISEIKSHKPEVDQKKTMTGQSQVVESQAFLSTDLDVKPKGTSLSQVKKAQKSHGGNTRKSPRRFPMVSSSEYEQVRLFRSMKFQQDNIDSVPHVSQKRPRCKSINVSPCNENLKSIDLQASRGPKAKRSETLSQDVQEKLKARNQNEGKKLCQHADDDLLIAAIIRDKKFSFNAKHSSLKTRKSQSKAGIKPKGKKGSCKLMPRTSGKDGRFSIDERWSSSGARTVLSWLIDGGVVLVNDVIQYRSPKDGAVVKDGWITKDGILCKCCNKMLSVSKFKVHAGFKMYRPCLNLFLESGKQFTLCQLQAWSAEYKARKGIKHVDNLDVMDQNDDTCGLCGDGGELICCDNCPSTFHQICLAAQELPEGSWFCPNCTCGVCGAVVKDKEPQSSVSVLKCSQCEHRYHGVCIGFESMQKEEVSNTWFCGVNCQQVYTELRSRVGALNPIADGFSWTLLRCIHGEQKVHSAQKFALMAECNTKLAVALTIMEECFIPMLDTRTGINMISHVLYNWGSEFARLNYEGFYTVVLEKADELISVASIRVHGVTVAEMPLISTCSMHRRKGMCRRLLKAIEEMLRSVKVELLVISAIPSLVDTWMLGFGFKPMEDKEKQHLKNINLMVFPGTVLLKKHLYGMQPMETNQGPDGESSSKLDECREESFCEQRMSVESGQESAGSLLDNGHAEKSAAQREEGSCVQRTIFESRRDFAGNLGDNELKADSQLHKCELPSARPTLIVKAGEEEIISNNVFCCVDGNPLVCTEVVANEISAFPTRTSGPSVYLPLSQKFYAGPRFISNGNCDYGKAGERKSNGKCRGNISLTAKGEKDVHISAGSVVKDEDSLSPSSDLSELSLGVLDIDGVSRLVSSNLLKKA